MRRECLKSPEKCLKFKVQILHFCFIKMLRYIDAVRVVPWKDSCKLYADTILSVHGRLTIMLCLPCKLWSDTTAVRTSLLTLCLPCKLWPDTTAVLLSGQHPCALLLCDRHFGKVPFCYLATCILITPVCSMRVERVEPFGRLATST